MAYKTFRQYTLSDLIHLRGDEPHDESLYIFGKKQNGGKPELNTPSRSDFYTILLVTKGSIQVKINLIDYTVDKNTILFFFPHVTFQFASFSEDLLYYGVSFTPDFLTSASVSKKYLNAFGFLSSHQSPLLGIRSADAGNLCSSIDYLYRRSGIDKDYPHRALIIQHLFTAFLYELAAVYKTNNSGKELKMTHKEEITVQFLQLLPLHFKEERSVKFYATHLYVTPKYLSQVVKDTTGKTAGYFIDEMVMLEAKVLLSDDSLSVAQVAEELHFSDQFFFSKFFKRIAGVTPSDYRRRIA